MISSLQGATGCGTGRRSSWPGDLQSWRPTLGSLEDVTVTEKAEDQKTTDKATATAAGDKSPSTSPMALRHHDEAVLDAIQLLIESGKARDIDYLIRYAEKTKAPQAAEFLRNLAPERLPLDLVFDALSVHTRIVAYKRSSGLLAKCQDQPVGLILPLPPHVLDTFLPLAKVSLLLPDRHPLPPSLRTYGDRLHQGSRASRLQAAQLAFLVFEAHRNIEAYVVDAGAADLLDPRILPADIQFMVHLRAHRNPEDVPLPISPTSLRIL